MIRTVLFDMGNVLVHFSHERMCAQLGAVCAQPTEAIHELLLDSGLQIEFERGQLSEQEFHRRFEQAVGRSVNFDELKTAGSDIFELNSPMLSVLDSLNRTGRRLVLLSNTSRTHFEFVSRNFDILDKFDDCVVSFKVGAVKPDPAIFSAALDVIQCKAEECFYTDDIAEYVAVGRSFGFQAEVFTDASRLVAQLQQHGLSIC